MDPLDTDSCRGTVPMEPPMSNSSMRHREPKSEIDDTSHVLQGASCTIAARIESSIGYELRAVPTFIWKPISTPNNAINHAACHA